MDNIIIDENDYNEIKNILSGCRTLNDAKYFIKLHIKKNPKTKKIAYNMLCGKNYGNAVDLHTFYNLMEKINNSTEYECCMEIVNEYYNINSDDVQMKTLLKLINDKNFPEHKKPHQKNQPKIFDAFDTFNIFNIFNSSKTNKKETKEINKPCPHCNALYIGTDKTTYVVCGYSDTHRGYDWKGCKKDWCFSCGKKLCKSWDDNKLYLEPNRIHDSFCCKKNATQNNESYDDFCKCVNKYVKR